MSRSLVISCMGQKHCLSPGKRLEGSDDLIFFYYRSMLPLYKERGSFLPVPLASNQHNSAISRIRLLISV